MTVSEDEEFLPAVHKLSQGGYDGRGVQVIRTKDDLGKSFDRPAILEKLIDIEKEIAQIIAVNENGEMAIYPAVEMIVDPALNLIDYQLCPARINEKTRQEAETIAKKLVLDFHSPGIFAVEMLVDPNGKVFVNETAPRVHNSGHHTIEACHCSQFDMLCRLMQGLPLGNAAMIFPSLMVNIVGNEGFAGPVKYEGIPEIMRMDNVYVHIYGKKQSRPGRKMGHVTMLGEDIDALIPFASKIKSMLISKT